jgi:alpha-glucuronidase
MHHVPYDYVLHSGKTVIQTIYDWHYEGATEAGNYAAQWATLKGRIDDQRFAEVMAQLEYQAGQARVWRDAVCSWFLRESGITDAKGRAGHFPDRIEAESMKLDGYQVIDVKPWEAASGGKAIECTNATRRCTASFVYSGPAGWRDLSVEYFDQNNGASRFQVFVAGQLVDEWVADDNLPTKKPDGSSSTLRKIPGLALRPGDEIRIEGVADGNENAPLDYAELAAPE